MNKYQYYVYKIVHTEYIGDIGIDTTETDEKKFNSFMRKIEKGHIVLIGNKTFRRKKI